MKYVLLLHQEERSWNDIPEAEREALMAEFFAFTRDIRESGHYVASAALQPAATARNVRVRGGQVQATDGPFAETREQVGGFYMVDVASLDEAVAIAARIPAARLGTIEVRAIVDFAAGERPRADAAAATTAA